MSRPGIHYDFVVKALLGVFLLAAVPMSGNATELQTETLKAWDEYIRSADLRMQSRPDGPTSFLWTDEAADRRQRIGRGEIQVEPVLRHGTKKVPNGLIHDWIGGVFIPGATIENLSAVIHDYNRYKDIYRPVVVDSKRLSCTATEQRFSMLLQRKVLFVTAAIEGEFRAREVRLDSQHGYYVADAIQLQEVENYGRPGERLLPPGTGHGYMWRLHSIARYEWRDGGVYFELEAIALTRDIPASLRWMVSSTVNHLSINGLMTTLQQTRDAVNMRPDSPPGDETCPSELTAR